ncbi:MAG: deoxyribose-phosphate aldolase [Candidatus Buchananbacteria bacterium]
MPSIASYIDHTLLRPEATIQEIIRLCQQAKEFGFYSVCVNPCYVTVCKRQLEGSSVKVCAVVGFPLGANCPTLKAEEAKMAIEDGADEIDMVINIGYLVSEGYDLFDLIRQEIGRIVSYAHKHNVLVKVIIETALLTNEEKTTACKLAVEAGADFVKTCTGFNGGQATVEDVKLMKAAVGAAAEVKASGGIRDYATAMAMIEAGAKRLGTSSGVKIVLEETSAEGSC